MMFPTLVVPERAGMSLSPLKVSEAPLNPTGGRWLRDEDTRNGGLET